jgi:LmbE family N-acetylglucosaminyl deacetylase
MSLARRGMMMVVISPHLDDAVLSCGQMLAARPGSVVITVFAGMPRNGSQQTDWDRCCGFANAAQAVAERRKEDRLALAALQAKPHWLDFVDSQYGESPAAAAEVGAALAAALSGPPTEPLLLPLGLFHSDHVLVHEAALIALPCLPSRPLLLYEDLPYRSRRGLVQQRLAALARAGWCATPAMEASGDAAQPKARALKAYASQLRCLKARRLLDAEAPERYWRLEPQCHGG